MLGASRRTFALTGACRLPEGVCGVRFGGAGLTGRRVYRRSSKRAQQANRELSPKGIDKGVGVTRALAYLGREGNARTFGFGDSGNDLGMLDMYENGNVQGFTTNPSLMKKGGVTDYRAFAKEVLAHITDVSVSFEVFADDVETMEVEAREIATWAENVYVKIPCVTTKGESTAELVRKLSADGIKVNVTTIFTPEQVDEMVEAVDAETPSIISLFAGRIADTGVDPIPFVTESVKKAAAKPNCEVLWASTRELINIYQAEACGCQIITVPNSILAKRKNIGRDPYEVSLDTVRGFAKDIASLGFHILP